MIPKTNFEFRRSGTNILFSAQIAGGQIDHIFGCAGQLLIYSINSIGSKTLKLSVLNYIYIYIYIYGQRGSS